MYRYIGTRELRKISQKKRIFIWKYIFILLTFHYFYHFYDYYNNSCLERYLNKLYFLK